MLFLKDIWIGGDWFGFNLYVNVIIWLILMLYEGLIVSVIVVGIEIIKN